MIARRPRRCDIGDDQPAHPLGGGEGERHRRLAAHAVADEAGPIDPVCIEIGQHVRGQVRVRHAARVRRASVVALVDQVTFEPRPQPAGDGAPVGAGAEQAVRDECGPAPANDRRFERNRYSAQGWMSSTSGRCADVSCRAGLRWTMNVSRPHLRRQANSFRSQSVNCTTSGPSVRMSPCPISEPMNPGVFLVASHAWTLARIVFFSANFRSRSGMPSM